MDTDVLGRLFNRAITHMVTGTIALLILFASINAFSGYDVYSLLTNSALGGTASIWIVGVFIFIMGGLIDSLALMILDDWLLTKLLESRPSNVNIINEHTIRFALTAGLVTEDESKLKDLKTMRQRLNIFIPSFFETQAPEHMYAKRDEIDALYQYHSNMFVLMVILLFMTPILVQKFLPVVPILLALVIQTAITLLFFRFTYNALKRVNSIEDNFFIGLISAQFLDWMEDSNTASNKLKELTDLSGISNLSPNIGTKSADARRRKKR